MKYILLIAIFIILCFTNTNLYSQIISFPENAMGTRCYAMGKIASASYSDAVAVSINPSNIIGAERINASIFYSKFSSNAKNTSFGMVFPTKKLGTFGLSNFVISIDDFSTVDTNNTLIDTFCLKQNHFLLSYGRNFQNNFSLGFNAKFVTSNYGSYNSGVKNVGIDFGCQYFIKNMSFGFVIENLIMPIVKIQSFKETLPREYRVIVEKKYSFQAWSITAIANLSSIKNGNYSKDTSIHLGFECSYKGLLFWSGTKDNEFSIGAGLNYYDITIGYSYGKFSSAFKHRSAFSLSYSL